MEKLRERTSYLKFIEEKVKNIETDGRFIDLRETPQGGASLVIDLEDLECLDGISKKFNESGRIVEGIVNDKGDEIILVDEDGLQIPFEMVMKALFG